MSGAVRPTAVTPYEEMTALVTVKAYPSISQTYGESVCVAGIRLDKGEPHLVRLFPVKFRELEPERRFKKYQVVKVLACKHSTDRRVETWRPVQDSFEPAQFLPAGEHWPQRRRWVDPMDTGLTMCELNRGRKGGGPGPSLGLVRPARVLDVLVADAEGWSAGQLATLGQGNLLVEKQPDLEKPPYRFLYKWLCEEPGCRGHEQTIVDWEVLQAYRSWRDDGYSDPVEAVRHKFLHELCAPTRDTRFFVGDQHQHPGAFLVLGVFWPKNRPDANQLQLAFAA